MEFEITPPGEPKQPKEPIPEDLESAREMLETMRRATGTWYSTYVLGYCEQVATLVRGRLDLVGVESFEALLKEGYVREAEKALAHLEQTRRGDLALMYVREFFYCLEMVKAQPSDLKLDNGQLESLVRQAFERQLEDAPWIDMLSDGVAGAYQKLGEEEIDLEDKLMGSLDPTDDSTRQDQLIEGLHSLDAAGDLAKARNMRKMMSHAESAREGLKSDIAAKVTKLEQEAREEAKSDLENWRKKKG